MTTSNQDNVIAQAVLSPDNVYRYLLTRRWRTGPLATFVMLNPSVADAKKDDPTIRRCVGFARTWGLAGIAVVNLYALVSTDPRGLWQALDPVGPENDAHIHRALFMARIYDSPVIAAWGVGARPERVQSVLRIENADRFSALRITKDGHPGHPARLRGDSPLAPWPAEPQHRPPSTASPSEGDRS